METARRKMAKFLNAPNEKCIVFNRGCTEGINMVAGGFERGLLNAGYEILITAMEHHANIVPWQMACAQTDARLKVVPITPTGEVDLDSFQDALTEKPKIVASSHSSHVLRTLLRGCEQLGKLQMTPLPAEPQRAAVLRQQDCFCDAAHQAGKRR